MNHIIIDRSNLDEVVCYSPAEKRSYTRREELVKYEWCSRKDIVLLNGRGYKQYALYVTSDGFAGDLFILDILSEDEFLQVLRIAERMRQNAIDFPDAKKLLVG